MSLSSPSVTIGDMVYLFKHHGKHQHHIPDTTLGNDNREGIGNGLERKWRYFSAAVISAGDAGLSLSALKGLLMGSAREKVGVSSATTLRYSAEASSR